MENIAILLKTVAQKGTCFPTLTGETMSIQTSQIIITADFCAFYSMLMKFLNVEPEPLEES